MAIKFNPLTGNFDFTGGGGGGSSYIDGEEATYNDLSLDAGVAPLNSAWLVRNSSGIWPFNKPGGIYIRTATLGVSRDADYTYAGTMPDVFSDAVLTIYDEASTTRTGQFNLGSVTAGQNRVLTWPDANGTIARTETFAAPPAIGNTTAAAGSFTTLSASDALTASNATASPPTTLTATKGLQWLLPSSGYAAIAGIYPGSPAISLLTGSPGGMSELARFSSSGIAFNSPLTLTGGTVAASAPVIDATQTWSASGTTFTGFRLNVTNTASASASLIADWQLGGTSQMQLRRDGTLRVGSTDVVSYAIGSNNGGFTVRASSGCGWNMSGSTITTEICTLIEQRHGTNAQEYRLFGTFTSSTNYQRLTIKTKAVTLSGLTGASVATTTGFIPDGAVLVGLTTRVSTAITGATGYDIGDGSDANRWGANIGIALNTSSDNRDWTAGTIECFTAAQEVTLTAVGSNFTGGAVVIVAHYLAGEAD
jgi:hypothetical protein